MSANLCEPELIAMLGIQMCKYHPSLSMDDVQRQVEILAAGSLNSIISRYPLEKQDPKEVYLSYLLECLDQIPDEKIRAKSITPEQVFGAASYASYQNCESSSDNSIFSLNACVYLKAHTLLDIFNKRTASNENIQLLKEQLDSIECPVDLRRVVTEVLARPLFTSDHYKTRSFAVSFDTHDKNDTTTVTMCDEKASQIKSMDLYKKVMEGPANYKDTHYSPSREFYATAEALAVMKLFEDERLTMRVTELDPYGESAEPDAIPRVITPLGEIFFSNGAHVFISGFEATSSWVAKAIGAETTWGYEPESINNENQDVSFT